MKMADMAHSKMTGPKMPTMIATFAIIAGAIWRWYMVYVAYRPSENIFSDIAAYVSVAERMLQPGRTLDGLDLIQPAGTSLLLSISLYFTGSLVGADAMWFIISALTPILWFLTAKQMFGTRIGVVVAIWTSFHFSSITFASMFMSETPFTFLVAAGWLCVARTVAGPENKQLQWAAAAGLLWGLSLLFRGQALCLLLMLFVISAFDLGRIGITQKNLLIQLRKPLTTTLVSFVLVALSMGVFFSLRAGQPMLTSLNFGGTALMGHLPDAAEVKFEPPGKNFYHVYGSPAVHQRRPEAKYLYPFSIVDNKAAMASAWQTFKENPLRYIMMSFKSAGEAFFGNDPWPANQQPFADWLRLYESLFLLMGIVPACTMVLHAVASNLSGTRQVMMLAVPITGVWIMSFITQGESRYRIPFDGEFIILSVIIWTAIWSSIKARVTGSITGQLS